MFKKHGRKFMSILLTLTMVISLLSAMTVTSYAATTGTADGTYDFGGLVDSGGYEGAGFKTQGDKFLVSQCFAQDGATIYANDTNAGGCKANRV